MITNLLQTSLGHQKLILKAKMGKKLSHEEVDKLHDLGIEDIQKLENPQLNPKFYEGFNQVRCSHYLCFVDETNSSKQSIDLSCQSSG